jgi:hypothetical protein
VALKSSIAYLSNWRVLAHPRQIYLLPTLRGLGKTSAQAPDQASSRFGKPRTQLGELGIKVVGEFSEPILLSLDQLAPRQSSAMPEIIEHLLLPSDIAHEPLALTFKSINARIDHHAADDKSSWHND